MGTDLNDLGIREVKRHGLVIKIGILIVISLASCFVGWFFWLAPINLDSPLVSRIPTPAGELSQFSKDVFGSVYIAHHSRCRECFSGGLNIKLDGANSSDFIAMSREFGKTSNRVYWSEIFGGEQIDLSSLDAASVEVIRDGDYPMIRDRYHVYYFPVIPERSRMYGVENPKELVPVTAPKTIEDPYFVNEWYKDKNHVYYRGVRVLYADPATIELTLDEGGKRYLWAKDKNFVYNPQKSLNGESLWVDDCDNFESCVNDFRHLDEETLSIVYAIDPLYADQLSADPTILAPMYLSLPSKGHIPGFNLDTSAEPVDVVGNPIVMTSGSMVSRELLGRHSEPNDCWVSYQGSVYDISLLFSYLFVQGFISKPVWGSSFELLEKQCGSDVTDLINEQPTQKGSLNTARFKYALQTFYVGTLSADGVQ
jgi:cytochrome b involved in lipid metabolism